MAEIKDWDVAAANNNDPSPDGAPEGMAPSGVNDVIRENMAVLARWKGDNDGTLDSGGSSNAYTLTPNGTYSAYSRGDTFRFEANHTNTGSATLNVSSLGAKTIKHVSGATLSENQILSGGVYQVVYDGTDFLLENPSLIDAGGNARIPGGHFSRTGSFTVAASGTTTEVIDGLDDFTTYIVSFWCRGANMELSLVGVVISAYSPLVSAVATLASGDFNAGSVALQTKGNATPFTLAGAGSGLAFQFVCTGDGVSDVTATWWLTKLTN